MTSNYFECDGIKIRVTQERINGNDHQVHEVLWGVSAIKPEHVLIVMEKRSISERVAAFFKKLLRHLK